MDKSINRKSSRQVKLTDKMKAFNGLVVKSSLLSPLIKVINGENDVNPQTPGKYPDNDDSYLSLPYKKPRIMDDLNETRNGVDTNSSFEHSDNENQSHRNISNGKLYSMDNVSENEAVEENEEFSEYELIQRKNIEERNQFLKTLGIENALNDFSTIKSQSNQVKKTPQSAKSSRFVEVLPKREPSRRLQALAAAIKAGTKERLGVDLYKCETGDKQENKEIDKEEVDDRLKGTVLLELEEDELNILKSFPSLDENCTYDPNIDIKSCNIESFRSNLGCLRMIGPHKVTAKRIQSICVHPSITKQIVLAGCVSGSLGLWDINAGVENDVVEFSYHKAPLNRVTVSNFNHCKIFTTSHEGTVCSVDIDHKKCTNVFSTDHFDRVRHLTWHEELDANTLLISHGDGSVGVLDIREDATNKLSWINCFERSCRTVQIHPMNPNYFLVSSGTVGCKIFDLRSCPKSVCVSDLPHPKGLTSAFFSPDGNNILTTCNDDRLRIFDSSSFLENLPKQKRALAHNNHTGRWLSVFKAFWFPYRNDAFTIGSLMSPRRIQIYENSGSLLYELQHEDMLTISPVIGMHPKFLLIAGGNSSGRVHAFVPPNSEET